MHSHFHALDRDRVRATLGFSERHRDQELAWHFPHRAKHGPPASMGIPRRVCRLLNWLPQRWPRAAARASACRSNVAPMCYLRKDLRQSDAPKGVLRELLQPKARSRQATECQGKPADDLAELRDITLAVVGGDAVVVRTFCSVVSPLEALMHAARTAGGAMVAIGRPRRTPPEFADRIEGASAA